jgi:hypothetical protein
MKKSYISVLNHILLHQKHFIMLPFNWLAILSTGLIPLAVGALWYGPIFGKAWMHEAGMTDEKIKGANMGLIYGLALLFSIMYAVGLLPVVIHQMHVNSSLLNQQVDVAGSDAHAYLADYMMKYSKEFRTFGHGAFHGLLTGIFVILPVLGTNALFERKSWKYILINVAYWTICAMLMGGVICAYA